MGKSYKHEEAPAWTLQGVPDSEGNELDLGQDILIGEELLEALWLS